MYASRRHRHNTSRRHNNSIIRQRIGMVRRSANSRKSQTIYQVPHDNSGGEVLPLTSTEVENLKNITPISNALQLASLLTKIPKLPVELVSSVLEYAGLFASFSIETDVLARGRNNMNYEYLRLSIPLPETLDLPAGVTLGNKCLQCTVECTSHDQGWASEDNQHDGTYVGSYTWSEVAILKLNEQGEEFESDRAKIISNRRAVREFRHHLKQFHEPDGFVKNIELGDSILIYLRSVFPGWANSANFARITAQFPILVNNYDTRDA